jgi:hypothetical protein
LGLLGNGNRPPPAAETAHTADDKVPEDVFKRVHDAGLEILVAQRSTASTIYKCNRNV